MTEDERRPEETWADEAVVILAGISECIGAMRGLCDIVVPTIIETVTLFIVLLWRLELQKHLMEHWVPARMASFIAFRLPERCLRLLVGRVIAVDVASSEVVE